MHSLSALPAVVEPLQIRVDLRSVSLRRIGVEVTLAEPAREVDFALPVWTPGSYLVREYSRHLLAVAAADASGAALPLVKTAKNRYRVTSPAGCGRVAVRYEVYANALTVREAAVGPEFAFWNGACVYLWPVGEEQRPAVVEVELPDGWGLFCGAPLDDGRAFRVSGLDEAIDLPCLAASDPVVVSFAGVGRELRFVCAGLGPLRPPPSLADDTARIVERAAAVFGGEVPFDRYTFLALFAGEGRGGLEHATSAALLAPRTTFAPRRSYEEFMSLVAHELFHVWNGKHMRPRELVRFAYDGENYTRLLWVVEGFTAYYDDHLCLRAGVIDARTYLGAVSSHAENMQRMPGRFAQSLAEASFDAWIRFYRQDENTRNTTQNYYSNGALAAICLDSRIRDATDGERSLDDVMRLLWEHTRETGYTIEDVTRIASEVAGEDLSAELRTLTDSPFDPDLVAALAVFGLDAVWQGDDQPAIGVQFRAGETTVATVLDGTSAWRAGLAPGDEVLAVAGLRVQQDTWGTVFPQVARDGEPVELLISRRGRIETVAVVPERRDRARLEIRAAGDADERALRLREGWLGPSARGSWSG